MIEDRAQWRWVASRFAVTTRLKPRQRIMMRGVEFNLDDLIKLQPDVFRSSAKRVKAGRPENIDGRDSGWLEIVNLAVRGELHRNAFPTQESLKQHVYDTLNQGRKSPVLGSGKVREIVQMVFPRIPDLE